MPALLQYPVVDGKRVCSKCKAEKPLSNFHKAPTKIGYQNTCAECKKVWAKDYRQRPERKIATAAYHSERWKNDPAYRETLTKRAAEHKRNRVDGNERRNEQRRAWALREKLKAIAYKGGSCICCGYADCPAAMDFHHPNPEEKEGLKAHWTFEKNKPELDKCVLVCARCHRELHAGFREL